jgi:hypothetical protein
VNWKRRRCGEGGFRSGFGDRRSRERRPSTSTKPSACRSTSWSMRPATRRQVRRAGFEAARAEEQARARASWKGGSQKSASPAYRELPKTDFLGYKQLTASNCEVLAIVKDGVGVPAAAAGDLVEVVLDQTSFYGDSGGQTGDTGWFTSADGNTTVAEIQGCVLPVQGVRAHKALLKQSGRRRSRPHRGRWRAPRRHPPQPHRNPPAPRRAAPGSGHAREAGRLGSVDPDAAALRLFSLCPGGR